MFVVREVWMNYKIINVLFESIIEILWFIECLSRFYDEEKIDMKLFDYKCILEYV